MRVCDLIASYIQSQGIKDIFMVPGGGVMYLTDGLACNKELNKVSCHHEQAAAMAAVAYAKYAGMGCAYFTTGCGGTNAITGVLNAWQDNVSCVFISGQCKIKETISYTGLPIRQIGVQEADITSLVRPITKYTVMIDSPDSTLYHLEKAFYIAKHGRRGPVWIDVPLDIQAARIDTSHMKHFDEKEIKQEKTAISEWELRGLVDDIKKARRPVIIAGHGIRISGAVKKFYELIHKYKIPVVCSRMGLDVLPTTDQYNIGRIGNKGTRAANFAVQNADLVVALGSRLSVSSTGQQYEYFAREAKVIAVDIDKYEHMKNTVHVDQVVIADVRNVIDKILSSGLELESIDEWRQKCFSWKEKYPVCRDEYYDDSAGINLYVFIEELSKCLDEDDVVVTDTGSALFIPSQGLKTSSLKQRYITSGAQAEMGFTLPAAIGVSVAKGKGRIIGITGDGSFQMNIQELQTMLYHNLPVKLFVLNNDGYLTIRATQKKYFDERYIGTDNESGISFPDLSKIAYAYGIEYYKMERVKEMSSQFKEIMESDRPVICEVMSIRNQEVIPSVSSVELQDGSLMSKPIEDMYPFLGREEFKKEMVIEPVKGWEL